MYAHLVTLSLLAASAVAGPIERIHRRDVKAHSDITIHESCSGPQRRMLEQALKETFEVAGFAKDYVLANGAQDPIFKQYFGDKPQAPVAVVGVWESLLGSNKEGVIFRCDDIDGNCHQDGWRGHWRGDNATSETVICPASYTDRLFNAAFCMNDFQLAKDAPSTYWSIDLIHRLFHVPPVTNAAVDHYAETVGEVFELAKTNSSFSPFDSDALQYFAAHVYALEVAKGGDSCIGDITNAPAEEPAPATTTSAVPPGQTSTPTDKDCHTHADGTEHCVDTHTDASPSADAPADPAPSADSSAGQDCHTHADGTEHCEEHTDATPSADAPADPAPSADSSADATAGQDCHTHADGTEHCEEHTDAAPSADAPAEPAPSADSSAGKDCHTHADGTEHCV